MTYTKLCEQDGTEFEAAREHARFCSGRCRVAWFRAHAGEAEHVTRNSRAAVGVTRDVEFGSGEFGDFLAVLSNGQLEHCLFGALWDVLPATSEGREWLGEVVAGLKSRTETPGAADEVVSDYVRHFFSHALLARTFARIWEIALQAGAETGPESVSSPGRSTAAIVAQIAELTGKLEARNPDAFMARLRADDRESVTGDLENSARTLREWVASAELF